MEFFSQMGPLNWFFLFFFSTLVFLMLTMFVYFKKNFVFISSSPVKSFSMPKLKNF